MIIVKCSRFGGKLCFTYHSEIQALLLLLKKKKKKGKNSIIKSFHVKGNSMNRNV